MLRISYKRTTRKKDGRAKGKNKSKNKSVVIFSQWSLSHRERHAAVPYCATTVINIFKVWHTVWIRMSQTGFDQCLCGKGPSNDIGWTKIATENQREASNKKYISKVTVYLLNGDSLIGSLSELGIIRAYSVHHKCFWDQRNAQQWLNIATFNICIWLCQL